MGMVPGFDSCPEIGFTGFRGGGAIDGKNYFMSLYCIHLDIYIYVN
jgi:hypothetical protein